MLQPNIMEETEHPAHRRLQQIGREITSKVLPKAVVVLSAHWQGGAEEIQVNIGEDTGLIYELSIVPPT